MMRTLKLNINTIIEKNMSILHATILLLLVIDPLGNVPLFLASLKTLPDERRKWVVFREMIIALLVLELFLFFGKSLLKVLQLSESSLTIAGAVILFLISLKLIFPSKEGMFGYSELEEPFIFPLAIPAVAGPSAAATVLLFATREPDRLLEWALAILLACLITTPVLIFSGQLQRWMGNRGLAAFERLMGMLLTAIAVEMFIRGVRAVF